jgi:hypothetical protein
MTDAVNHPAHYTQGDIECIDALKSALGHEGFKSYCRGACIKYLWRTEHKNGLEDLKKCEWYLSRLIKEIQSEDLIEYKQLDLGILSR